MAWVRGKKYVVQFLGTADNVPGFMLENLNEHTFYDWTSKLWTDIGKFQKLEQMPSPVFTGTTQRFRFTIDTTNFPDGGNYCIYFVDANNQLLPDMLPEYFAIFQGSPEAVMPKTITLSVE